MPHLSRFVKLSAVKQYVFLLWGLEKTLHVISDALLATKKFSFFLLFLQSKTIQLSLWTVLRWDTKDWLIVCLVWVYKFVSWVQKHGFLLWQSMGVARQKIWGGPTESYGNEKYYYCWVHNICAKHTPSKGAWGHAPTGKFWKISPIRLNLEAILANNFIFFKECSVSRQLSPWTFSSHCTREPRDLQRFCLMDFIIHLSSTKDLEKSH